ncbi:cation:proton antiporter [Streptomyces caniscabiei]|uniref:cation:proton antiporter domain-containing protein n=1 Tax=Streptomyces caniscabiei TaxID=2746961 RepID=UPI0029B19650|nr:cation:proton antiporter [Streptomyces caniscabiei]MDX2775853.1 cation:proton antiporter [Streptomyces caniscabiei]
MLSMTCVGMALGGFGIALDKTPWLFALLLGVGLLGSTFGIDLEALRAEDWKLIIWAITVGVTAKASFTGIVMYAVTRDPRYFVVAISVAQMDPLSVGALLDDNSRLSPRARSLLRAWAALDDPVTVILTLGVILMLKLTHTDVGMTIASLQVQDLESLGLYAVHNVAFMAVIVFFWQKAAISRTSSAKLWLTVAFAAGGLLVGATWFWMFGLALLGLFMRPDGDVYQKAKDILDRSVDIAFYAAAIVVGALLVHHGVDVWHGTLLGVSVYASQALVTCAAPGRRSFSTFDRRYIMAAHQNGLTACSLAIVLGVVDVVAFAVVVTHVLNYCVNRHINVQYDKELGRE